MVSPYLYVNDSVKCVILNDKFIEKSFPIKKEHNIWIKVKGGLPKNVVIIIIITQIHFQRNVLRLKDVLSNIVLILGKQTPLLNNWLSD